METTTLHPVVMKLNFPFITRKPSFCGRTLIEGHNTELLHRYVLAMALELKANAADLADCEVQAIRLGGGSASIINGSDLDHLLRLIRSCYHVAENAPVTMRTCPADINGANMPFYNRSHVTRYDLELYSLEPLDFCTLDTLNYSEQMPTSPTVSCGPTAATAWALCCCTAKRRCPVGASATRCWR